MLQFVRLGLEHLWSQSLHKLVRLTDRLHISTGWSVKYPACFSISDRRPKDSSTSILLVVIQRYNVLLQLRERNWLPLNRQPVLSLVLNLTSD